MKIKGLLLAVFATMLFTTCSMFMEPVTPTITVQDISSDEDSYYLEVGEKLFIDLDFKPVNFTSSVSVRTDVDGVVDAVRNLDKLEVEGLEVGSTPIVVASGNVSHVIVVNVFPSGTMVPDVYLVPDKNIVSLELYQTFELNVSLMGSQSTNGYTWELEGDNAAQILEINPNGNAAVIRGATPGLVNVVVNHPAAEFPCEIMVMVEYEAAVSEKAISTSSNIIRMYDTGSVKTLTATLKNGTDLDNNDFTFTSENTSVFTVASNRNEVVINPVSAGSALLVIAHPDAPFDRNVLIQVLTTDHLGMITTNTNYIELHGNRVQINANLNGAAVDASELTWESNNENIARILGLGTGPSIYVEGGANTGQAIITVSHPEILTSTDIYVQNNRNSNTVPFDSVFMEGSTTLLRVVEGHNKNFSLTVNNISRSIGALNTGMSLFNEDNTIASIAETNVVGEYLISGLKPGNTRMIFKNINTSRTFELQVIVYPMGTDLDTIRDPYISTNTTAVYLTGSSNFKNISVYCEGDYSTGNPEAEIVWENNSNVVQLIPNGSSATIRPLMVGECWVTASHPEASNTIDFNIIVEELPRTVIDPYLTTEENYFQVVAGGAPRELNITGVAIVDETLYGWDHSNYSCLSIDDHGEYAMLQGLGQGTSTVTVTHPEADHPLEIVVDILPPGSTISNDPYITTTHNVVSILDDGETKNVSVTLRRGNQGDEADFVWTNTSDPNSILTLNSNRETAVLEVSAAGTAEITISHPRAARDLVIKVIGYHVNEDGTITDENGNVIDPFDPGTSEIIPYLTTSNDVFYVHESVTKELRVNAIGIADKSLINWECSDPSMLYINSTGETSLITGQSRGECIITVTHPEAPFPLEVLTTVLAPGEPIPNDPYITSSNNVVTIYPGSSKTASVSLYSGNIGDNNGFIWEESSDLFDIQANGNKVTILSTGGEGVGEIRVTHPKASREYIIRVIISNDAEVVDYPYISTPKGIYTLDQNAGVTIPITINNITSYNESYFEVRTDSTDVSYTLVQDELYIVSEDVGGVNDLYISHPACVLEKRISIIVSSLDPDDMSGNGFGDTYIVTPSPIKIMDSTSPEEIKLSLNNQTDEDRYGFIFASSSDEYISVYQEIDVLRITPKASGLTRLTINHPDADYPSYITIITSLPGDQTNLNGIKYLDSQVQFMSMVEGNRSEAMEVYLIGGSDIDQGNIQWRSLDNSILQVIPNGNSCEFQALAEGSTRVEITHPDSENIVHIVVEVGQRPLGSSIVLTSNKEIINIRPDGTTEEINVEISGISDTALESVIWSVDKPEIVSLTSNRGLAQISSSGGEGTAVITAKHPLSTNVLNFVIQVSNVTDFSFQQPYIEIQEGKSRFLSLTVPGYSLSPESVTYTSSNTSVVTVRGNDEVLEITAVSEGSANITATALNGSTAKMMIRVNPLPPEDPIEYSITTPSTMVTMSEFQTGGIELKALLVNGTVAQQDEIRWRSMDESIVSIDGHGSEVRVIPNQPGSTSIIITHPVLGDAYMRTINIAVTGILYDSSFDKSFVSANVGDDTQKIKLSLHGSPPESAYGRVTWTSSDTSIVDVYRAGQTSREASLLLRSAGEAVIYASYPGGSVAQCRVVVTDVPYVNFLCGQSLSVEPGQQVSVALDILPENGQVNVYTDDSTVGTVFYEPITKTVTVLGGSVGVTTLGATITVNGDTYGPDEVTLNCEVNYSITPSRSTINDFNVTSFGYTSTPAGAPVTVSSTNTDVVNVAINQQNRTINVIPQGVGEAFINLTCGTATSLVRVNYDASTLEMSLVTLGVNGYDRRSISIAGNTINMLDGRNPMFELRCSNPVVDVEIVSAEIIGFNGSRLASHQMEYRYNWFTLVSPGSDIKTYFDNRRDNFRGMNSYWKQTTYDPVYLNEVLRSSSYNVQLGGDGQTFSIRLGNIDALNNCWIRTGGQNGKNHLVQRVTRSFDRTFNTICKLKIIYRLDNGPIETMYYDINTRVYSPAGVVRYYIGD